MTIRNAIDTLLSFDSGGVQTDDRRLHPKLVYHTLLGVRSTLLTNKMNKKQLMSDWTHQILPCVRLVPVDASVCPCIPPKGCTVMRSKLKVPKFLSGLSYYAIEGLYSPDMQVKFHYTSRASFRTTKGNKYTSNSTRVFMIQDEYLYVYGQIIPEVMVLKGILYDPTESKNFLSDCDGPGGVKEYCYNILDFELYIDPDLRDPLLEMTDQKLKARFNRNPDSNTNNSQEDARS